MPEQPEIDTRCVVVFRDEYRIGKIERITKTMYVTAVGHRFNRDTKIEVGSTHTFGRRRIILADDDNYALAVMKAKRRRAKNEAIEAVHAWEKSNEDPELIAAAIAALDKLSAVIAATGKDG